LDMVLSRDKNKRNLCIILDTNFLFVPYLFKIDILDEFYNIINTSFEILILKDSIEELKRKLMNIKSEKQRKEIEMALEYAKNFKVIDVDFNKSLSVDDKIVEFALLNNCIVATNDKELRKKLKRLGIPIICVRGKKYLTIYGYY